MGGDDDDDYGSDPELFDALLATVAPTATTAPPPPPLQQPAPQKLSQPLERTNTLATAAAAAATAATRPIAQPTPQIVSGRRGIGIGATIQVSPRQKGNPVLACLRSVAWEYSDVATGADYVLGATTCALFLSLRYHRLHPEYLYGRISSLRAGAGTGDTGGLRLLLALVDVPNHEDVVRELAKACVVNGLTLVLCWSAPDVARYLELYKTLEHVGPAAIKGRPPASYSERVVEFVTVPRGVNKVDAVTLVSCFGTLRNAVNADLDAIIGIPGWGERKIRRWTEAVEEPFRSVRSGTNGQSAQKQ